jgi:glycosyltransferase involved in cell wall biosynthesis
MHQHGWQPMTTESGPGSARRDESGDRRLRILLITDKVPARDNGYAMRVENVMAGLSAAGDLHACLIDSSPTGTSWTNVGEAETSVVRASNSGSLSNALRLPLGVPNNVRYADEETLRSRVVAAIGDGSWDVVWCSRARVQQLTASLVLGPRIVDLDDLNDELLRSEIRDRLSQRGWLATLPRDARDWLDARLWSRLQRHIAATVDRVVVCSEADQRRLPFENCSVVPNGYPYPEPHPTRGDRQTLHRLLAVGPLTYEPNYLAVRWLVTEVLPLIRAAVPDVELTVVGEHDGVSLRRLSGPGVTFTGHVPDVTPHYASASIAVVALHSGAGTRIKVIEALARGIPLVSTSFGCYGHDLEPGRDVLLADDPSAYASACISLLNDAALYERLATNGRQRYLTDLTAADTIEAVRALVVAVAAERDQRAPKAWS